MAFISPPRTSLPTLNRPQMEPFGPIMRQLKTARVRVIRDTIKSETVELDTSGRGGAVLKYTDQGGDRHAATISHRVTGIIVCEYCAGGSARPLVAWCEHLRHLISTGADVTLWRRTGGLVMACPLVPSEGLFVTLNLSEPNPETELRTVNIPLDPVSAPVGAAPLIRTIGYLGEGFTIGHLRAMLQDFLTGALEDPELFYQGYDAMAAQLSEPERAFEAALSPFSQRFYHGLLGMPLAAAETAYQLSQDAPKF